MWSGPSRHDFFSEEIEFHLQDGVSDGWIENPTQVVPHSGKQNKGWIICNHGWKTNASEIYYRYFYNRIGQIVYTLEHILRTQWFLDRLNIDYFMTTYTSEVLPPDVLENPEVKHLWSLVDKQKFLPIDGCYEWCRDNTEIMFRRHDNHPLTEHHELFVKKFLKPHLKSLGLL